MSLLDAFNKGKLSKKNNVKSRGPRRKYTYKASLTSFPSKVRRELKLKRNYDSVAYEVPRVQLIKNLEIGLLNRKDVVELINGSKLLDYALLVDRIELDFDHCYLSFIFKGHGQVEYIVHKKGGEVIYKEILPKLKIEETGVQGDKNED